VNDLGAIASSMEVPATRGRLTWTFSPFLPLAHSLDVRGNQRKLPPAGFTLDERVTELVQHQLAQAVVVIEGFPLPDQDST
jgi:hypothetical protein